MMEGQICMKGTVLREGTNDQILAKWGVGASCAPLLPPPSPPPFPPNSKRMRGGDFSRESCSFYIKSKLKCENI